MNKWWKRIVRKQKPAVLIVRSGAMSNAEVSWALAFSRDASIMRALDEIAARLEDEMLDQAFGQRGEERSNTLARLEGVLEYRKQIEAWRARNEKEDKDG